MDYNKNELIDKIKQKKELKNISEDFIEDILNEYLKKTKLSILNLSNSELKIVVKEVRSKLRIFVGQYNSINPKINDKSSLLKTHSSTRERGDFYPELKNMIRDINPNSILDIGCGLNPLELADKKIEYFAFDINKSNIDIVSKYFKEKSIKGKAFVYDILCFNNDLPSVDLCLAFKVLDFVKKAKPSLIKKLIEDLDYKVLIISFSTKTLSGKKMLHKRRPWLEIILQKLNFPYKITQSKNEIFYIISKKN